jgi:hypothetical protein
MTAADRVGQGLQLGGAVHSGAGLDVEHIAEQDVAWARCPHQ